MNCRDARECFSALLDGDLGLTEQAPLELHLSQCAACRQELESLQRKRSPRSVSWLPRRGAALRIPPKLLAAATTLVLVAVLAVFVFQRSGELELAFRHWAFPNPSVESPPLPLPTPPLVASTEPAIRSETPAGAPPTTPVPTPSAPSPAARTPEASKPGRPAQQVPKAKSGAKQEAPSAGAAAIPTASLAGGKPGAMDVVGRLLVKSRSAAERDLAALLARAGGSALSRQRGPRITVIEALVPHPGYGRFTEGLARIGTWQVEAGRSALPDPVRVTVRLEE